MEAPVSSQDERELTRTTMNRWSALAMKGKPWNVIHRAGDLRPAREAHLTPKEAHGENLISTLSKYVGKSPDPNESVLSHFKLTKLERAGVFLVSCWCGRTFVQLEQRLIGRTTLSCGRSGCYEGGFAACENCGKQLTIITHQAGKGRKSSSRWCSSKCQQQGYKKERIVRGGPSPLRAVFEWKEPPLTELEQYDREIERLSAEIKQLQGEGHANIDQ